MSAPIKFLRRVGPSKAGDAQCVGCDSCPDILELESGDFAIIGKDITDTAKPHLSSIAAGCGPDERVVLLPRNLLVKAKAHIPNQS